MATASASTSEQPSKNAAKTEHLTSATAPESRSLNPWAHLTKEQLAWCPGMAWPESQSSEGPGIQTSAMASASQSPGVEQEGQEGDQGVVRAGVPESWSSAPGKKAKKETKGEEAKAKKETKEAQTQTKLRGSCEGKECPSQ